MRPLLGFWSHCGGLSAGLTDFLISVVSEGGQAEAKEALRRIRVVPCFLPYIYL